jgi:hypothetical protein
MAGNFSRSLLFSFLSLEGMNTTMRSFSLFLLYHLSNSATGFVPSPAGGSSRTALLSSYLDSLSNNPNTIQPAVTSVTSTNDARNPPPVTPPAAASSTTVSSGGASPSAAIASMASSQSSILSSIAASIPDLAPKPDLSYDASSGFTIAGKTVTLDARDAPGPSNIAWISSLCIDDTLSSLTIFNGPLTDVPHLISRCAIINNGNDMHFFLDFRPRAYGAYDLRNEDGTYPGPETLGRKSFEYSGNRKEYDGKFGTEEVVAFLDGVVGRLEGDVMRLGGDMGSLGELEKVTRGPLALDLIVPLT